MPFDKNKLKRPDSDKVLEKFISGATADAVPLSKKGEGEGKKANDKKKDTAETTVQPKIEEAKSEQAKPVVPVIPSVVTTPIPTLTDLPLILQNDIKSGVTLNLYHNLFKSFKVRCQEQGKTPSDIFNKFMIDYLRT